VETSIGYACGRPPVALTGPAVVTRVDETVGLSGSE
jgi:hypothetical protein